MNTVLKVLILGIATLLAPSFAVAAPDLSVGDTAIYGGSPANIQPNVMIILDTSLSMNDEALPANPYTGGTVYPVTNACAGAGCATNTVYKCTAFGLECGNWTAHVTDVSTVTTSCPAGTNPQLSFQSTGQWNSGSRRLQTSGACASGNGIYALGNWINWRSQAGTPEAKIEIAKRVVMNVINSTTGVRFGLMEFNNNQGAKLLTDNSYTATVKDMDAIFSGTVTNREALIGAIKPLVASSWTPLAESLFESMRYYQGGASVFSSPTVFTSPIQEACQQNYVVLVTDGMSTQDNDNVLRTICTTGANGIPGDCDQDGFEPSNDPAKTYPNSGSDYLDDVAKYMHDSDMSTTLTGTQNVITYTVGFGLGGANAGAVKLLNETAANGGGVAFLSNDEQELTSALTQILGQIFEVNSSFVAPVVPVSPENRTYSGGRVYLGFFKPQGDTAFWLGNLKKYGIDGTGVVVDKNGAVSNYADSDQNGIDDLTGAALPAGASNGSFKDTAVSHWSLTADGGEVDSGGAGEILLSRDFSTSPRKIYTYMESNAALPDASNAFALANGSITAGLLDVATASDRDKLVQYIHGIDSYDQDVDGDATEKRDWILGDILHSKPLVVNYASYTFSAANEADCNVNKAIIFAGANDGMLHAFKDCDGSEAWAFIPQDLLPNLRYLNAITHPYFVDGSPSVYIYDADKDGNIETGDRVVLLFGERRGGGQSIAPATGFYYALDITDPVAPRYLWRISNTESPSGAAAFAELGETWSDPQITTIKIGTNTKIVAIIGAGYDNLGEDGRFGAVQVSADLKGRGMYVIEVATLDGSGVPIFTASGTKLWGYTNGATTTTTTHVDMDYAIPSSVAVVDTDSNGFADRLYVGDAGGNMWRFDIGDTVIANWTGRLIFSANPGSGGVTDVGRKIFYRPSVVPENGNTMLLFGSGDREHPLDTAIVDRMYAVKDRGQISPKYESNLVDVTTDTLQVSTDSAVIASTLAALDSQDGWYIKLDVNSGEKVLSPVLTFFSAYFTTYSPDAVVSPDACAQGNLGTGRIYVLNYKTGEAVVDYDPSNNGTSTTNTRAQKQAGGPVLLRSDRVQTLGSGIPSGVVPIIRPGGEASILVGCGGGLCAPPTESDDTVVPLYWRRVM